MVKAPAPHPSLRSRPGPVVLCILDGVGIGSGGEDDAVHTARTPTLDRLRAAGPYRQLKAHGPWAGLPSEGDMGNSEVGHNAMGAGRIFDQGAKLVDRAFATGAIFETPQWAKLIAGNTLHLIGLLSDGNVHSHVRHLHQFIERAAIDGVTRLRVHVLTDGRDVAARSALVYIAPLQQLLDGLSTDGRDYQIASGGGRMRLTMDRYGSEWAMVQRGWDCHVHGKGRAFISASEAVQTLYNEDPAIDDQWLPAFVITDSKGPVGTICDGDSVLLFNFRGDRALEISRAFDDDDVPINRGQRPDVFYAGMMEYDGDLHIPKQYLVQPPDIDRTVGEYLVAAGRRTFASSETHKFGHVTFFFNGNRSGVLDNTLECYAEIPSDPAPPQQRPWMRAAEITDRAVHEIREGAWDHVRLNYANGDMVGHTGDLEATRIALEVIDRCVARLEGAVIAADGILLVTADHGNADEMYLRKKGVALKDDAGKPLAKTSHTVNEVPFIVVDPRKTLSIAHPDQDAGLANIGTTILELCGLCAPKDYEPGLVALAKDTP